MFFFAKKKFLLCYLDDTFCWCFFYPINLIVVYPFNENKPQLPATFKIWGYDKTVKIKIKIAKTVA